ncbi:MAG TPA: hypothetical protein VIV40_43450 [Kofleriaceae bacterium]
MRKLFCGPMPYLLIASLAAAACSSDDVDSDEEARRAYLGLDGSIEKSLNLGFTGYNLASSANIDAQMTAGDKAGTLTVDGQVDKGSSTNKTMRLYIAMVGYDDGDVVYNSDGDTVHIVYDTSTDMTMQPYLDLKLANVPTGTLTGTLDSNTTMTGVYKLSGDIKGDLTINVTINGMLMAGTGTDVLRVPGSTTVVGTATNSDGGSYDINVTL